MGVHIAEKRRVFDPVVIADPVGLAPKQVRNPTLLFPDPFPSLDRRTVKSG
jgi:hypothetical protein